jgi:ribonuclease Z
MTPWFLLGRDHGFEVWGPEGTEQMVKGMRLMFGHDLEARVNRFSPIETLAIETHVVGDGVIYENNGVTVTAFPVEHADGNPAFGYRVDWNGHKVVLSGDTTLHENVIKHGTGADLIVHNVIAFSDRLSRTPEMKGVLAKLTTPEEIIARTRAAGYDGPLLMGVDRMGFEIGDDVKAIAPRPLDDLPNLDSKGQLFP